MKCLPLMTLLCGPFLAGASCSETLTDPCDVLVRMEPKPATNSYIVANDRSFAVSLAQHRLCGVQRLLRRPVTGARPKRRLS